MQIDRQRFTVARRRLDRSQAWVARQAGASRQALQHYLDGRPVPTDVYLRLVAVLGTTEFVVTPGEHESPKQAA